MFLELRNYFLNLIYKEKCLVCSCSKSNVLLCKNCQKDVQYLSTFAQRIFKEIPIYSMANYNGSIKKLIQLLKFSHKKTSAKVLSELLFQYFLSLNLNKDFIIIYPPTFFLKSASRGYNHMELIAKHFSVLTDFKLNNKLIKKIKPTKPQYDAKNRHSNIKDSFKINLNEFEKVKNKNLLLIDDITTSGATLEEIINCFLELNFKNITCLTISKAGNF